MIWDAARWPNFTLGEIACRHCGEVFIDPHAMDCLQKFRNLMGAPVTINSGHRCVVHNREIGGAPHSKHLGLAFDIAVDKFSRMKMYEEALEAGFTGFGFMQSALHLDARETPAHWDYGPESRTAWNHLIPAAIINGQVPNGGVG